MEKTKDFAVSKFAKELLDVRDNLERAFDHVDKLEELNEEQLSQIKVGVKLTKDVMDSTLQKFKIS